MSVGSSDYMRTQMREDVKIATGGLTVSCGIAPNTSESAASSFSHGTS